MLSPIVITGMGLVSPLGCGVEAVWQRLCRGESGISIIRHFNVEDFPIRIAGLVPSVAQDPVAGLDEAIVVEAKERKKLDRFALYALAAAEEALNQAGWRPETESEQQSTATIIGTGIGGFPGPAEVARERIVVGDTFDAVGRIGSISWGRTRGGSHAWLPPQRGRALLDPGLRVLKGRRLESRP